jgi:uroporphyrin-III C-methyltransferase
MSRVYLVGAGPGDPELLTIRAANLLRRADVVLHDALVPAAILGLIASTAEVIDIGKRCGQKLLSQEEINILLVHFGSTVGTTVRLKGGDPTIFGRAGEEISALRDAGIPYEIVPGITSATASAASAGISLTDRRFASSIVFVTAHRGPHAEETNWRSLVATNSTLAIYMPGSNYAELADRLIEAGLPSSTPCLVVSHAGQPSQLTLSTRLQGLATQSPLPSPSLLIVGECAGPTASSYLRAQTVEVLNETVTVVSNS